MDQIKTRSEFNTKSTEGDFKIITYLLVALRGRCQEYYAKEPVFEASPVLQLTETQGLVKKKLRRMSLWLTRPTIILAQHPTH
jgi:hypothetical protein